ncbi:MAG: ABC transporter ATP-binding protein [Propionibacteriaceae bacterium]|nr:ABC transporter ATP-binding protein [Propionibacteriaceae bacterium]
MSLLECRGVGVRRGDVEVVHDLSLTVDAGAWVAVVGPNGAGKTSLLHGVAALTPVTGHLRLGGDDPHGLTRRALARRVALMAQQPVVPPGIIVRDLVALGRTPFLRRFGTESAADRDAVERELIRLRLTTLAARPADRLSGGELQRVMLARALCQEPDLLLLDEPTSALDIGHQQGVLDLIDEQRHERGLTVLAAMHDLTLAAQYADRMILLDRGRLVHDGTPAEVLRAEPLNRTYSARVEVLGRPAGPAVIPLRPGGR